MFRRYNTPNANPEMTEFNTILKGEDGLISSLEDYFYKYNLKQYGKGSNKTRLCTELVYSVSPAFFLTPGTNKYDMNIIEKWTTTTMKYLESQFPDGQLIWAQVHLDESTPHIHAYVCGREWHEKWKKDVISHAKFFGSRDKLRNLQSSYADSLQRSGFLVQRGARGSTATHKETAKWRAEQKEKDKMIEEQEKILKDKDIATALEIENIKKGEAIERKARNKVIRKLCEKFNLNSNDISKEIEKAKEELIVINRNVLEKK